MKRIILVHGSPTKEEFLKNSTSPANAHWFPWLKEKAKNFNLNFFALDYPRPYDPIYEEWVNLFSTQIVDKNSILIGHSAGAGFLLRFLSENRNIVVNKVILVAPWLDPKKELNTSFLKFSLDTTLDKRNNIFVFLSTDDDSDLIESFLIIKKAFPDIHYLEYADKGHFCDKTFPEIITVIQSTD